MIGVLAIISTIIAIPIVGNESTHTDVTLESLELRLTNENIDVKKATAQLSLAKSQWDNAIADKAKSGSSVIETDKNRKYYPLDGEMDYEFATWELETTNEDIILDGKKLYFDYLFLNDEIVLQQSKVTRLEAELAKVNKKIELGSATVTERTGAELDVQKASFKLQELINDKDILFLDLNLLFNYDLDTSLVIADVEVPFDEYALESLDDHIEYVGVTNGDLEKLEGEFEKPCHIQTLKGAPIKELVKGRMKSGENMQTCSHGTHSCSH